MLTVVSVFVCCFSCLSIAALVTGIIGIVSGTQVRSAIQAHDYALAEQKSKAAKNMWIATAVILGVSVVLAIIMWSVIMSNPELRSLLFVYSMMD